MLELRKRKRDKAVKRIRSRFGRNVKHEILIFCSCRNIYAQVINLLSGITEITVSTCNKDDKKNHRNVHYAGILGKELAQKCSEKDIIRPSFNRGEKIFHGVVKAVADSFYGE